MGYLPHCLQQHVITGCTGSTVPVVVLLYHRNAILPYLLLLTLAISLEKLLSTGRIIYVQNSWLETTDWDQYNKTCTSESVFQWCNDNSVCRLVHFSERFGAARDDCVSYTGSFFWESTDLKAHYNVEASALIYYGDRLVVGGQRVQNDDVDENAETANPLTSSERVHSHECWLGEFRSINLDTVHDDDAAAPSFSAPVELLGPTGTDTQIAKIHIDTLGMERSRDLVVDSEEDCSIELTHCVVSVENDEATTTAERSIFVAGTIRLSTKDTGDNDGQRGRRRQLQHATLPNTSSLVTVFRLDSQGDMVWNTINKADSDNLPRNLVGLEYDGFGSITHSATAGSAAATPTTTQVKIVQVDPFDGAIGTVPAATDSAGSTTTSNSNWSNTASSTMELSSWQSSRGLWMVGIVWFGLGLLGCVYRFVGLSFLPSWRRNKYSHVVTSNRNEGDDGTSSP